MLADCGLQCPYSEQVQLDALIVCRSANVYV